MRDRLPKDLSQTATMIIDLDAISHNFTFLKSRLKPGSECAAVVKCDAYGLGAIPVSISLWKAGCRHFFVGNLDEGIALRRVLKSAHIYVLSALTFGQYKNELEAHNLIPVLGNLEQIEHWNNFSKAKDTQLKCALHFDTHMTRTGLNKADTKALCLSQLSHLEVCLVMSHLSHGESFSSPQNREQLISFEAICKQFPIAPASLANSGGIFLGEKFHLDMVRPGIALYGGTAFSPQLKPATHLFAQVVDIHETPSGTAVGYNSTYTTSSSTRIATLGIGYGDGLLRSLSNKGYVVHKGKRLPIVGNVSMDLTTVNVGDLPCQVGDWMEVYGESQPVAQLAESAGSIPYEFMTSINKRPKRLYIHEGEIFEQQEAS